MTWLVNRNSVQGKEMTPTTEADADWVQWALNSMGAVALLLFGLLYSQGNRANNNALTEALAAKELALAAKAAAKAEADAATDALRRELLATINTMASNSNVAMDRVWNRFERLGKEVAD